MLIFIVAPVEGSLSKKTFTYTKFNFQLRFPTVEDDHGLDY